jgi:nitroreductase
MDLDKAIQSRTSVRKFHSKKPDWRDIVEAIDAARYAPMTGGNNIMKFIILDDPEKIQKLAEASQQDFITTAQYVVVACSKIGRVMNAYGTRGERYSRQQAGAAMENFILKLVDLGLSTCWVGHFVDAQIKRVLKIPKDVNVEAIFPIGFPYSKKKTKKAPTDLDNLLYFNKYGQEKMRPPKKITSA